MEFHLVPSSPYTTLFAGLISAITLAIGMAFAWFAFTASKLSVSLDDSGLSIDVPFYGRKVPLSEIDVSSGRVVKLDGSSGLRPTSRTNGIGLPGYAVGWFRLKNGERALAALTARDEVVYLQTSNGYSLLLSVAEPQALLERLNEI